MGKYKEGSLSLTGAFVMALIEGISYSKGFEGIFHHVVAIPAGIIALYKFVIGFRKFKNI